MPSDKSKFRGCRFAAAFFVHQDGFVAQKEYGGVTESGLKEFLIICGLRM